MKCPHTVQRQRDGSHLMNFKVSYGTEEIYNVIFMENKAVPVSSWDVGKEGSPSEWKAVPPFFLLFSK